MHGICRNIRIVRRHGLTKAGKMRIGLTKAGKIRKLTVEEIIIAARHSRGHVMQNVQHVA